MFEAFEFCLPERNGERVRLITRGGHDWTKRYPWIVEAALKNRQQRFVIDDDDLRSLPLTMRKANLQRLLARRPDGIFIREFEQGGIGPDLFRKACEFGLEGLVSKHQERPYRGGRSKHWLKVKNRNHPAFERAKESFAKGRNSAAGEGPLRGPSETSPANGADKICPAHSAESGADSSAECAAVE